MPVRDVAAPGAAEGQVAGRRAARGAAGVRAAAPARRADGGRRRGPAARRRHVRAGHARAARRRLAPVAERASAAQARPASAGEARARRDLLELVLGEHARGCRPSAGAAADVVVDPRAAEHDRQVRPPREQHRRGLEAVDPRHARVQHDDVRARARRAARAPPRRRPPRPTTSTGRPASATIVRIRKRTSAWSSTISGAHGRADRASARSQARTPRTGHGSGAVWPTHFNKIARHART